jgi:hypothetical protein
VSAFALRLDEPQYLCKAKPLVDLSRIIAALPIPW